MASSTTSKPKRTRSPRKLPSEPVDSAVMPVQKQYRPIHVRVEKLVNPQTGEVVGALVPLDEIAARSMRERGFTIGSEWKGEFKQVRDIRLWRRAHALGGWLADNHEMFVGLGQHEALKWLQSKSGIGCNSVRYKIPGFATIVRHEPLTLAFDRMEEGQFREYWDGGQEMRGQGGWIGWMRHRLYQGLNAPTVAEIEYMVTGERDLWGRT